MFSESQTESEAMAEEVLNFEDGPEFGMFIQIILEIHLYSLQVLNCTHYAAIISQNFHFCIFFTYFIQGTFHAGTEIDSIEELQRTPTPIMAPKFITKIKDTRAARGHQAIFECVVPDTKGVCCKW